MASADRNVAITGIVAVSVSLSVVTVAALAFYFSGSFRLNARTENSQVEIEAAGENVQSNEADSETPIKSVPKNR